MDEPQEDFSPATAEDEFPDWPESELGDDEWTEADEEALADLNAGRVISHEAVMRWLRSLGTENELPPPECGM